tara:strand:- start:213 stop:449 length:237 start_codon:yes stop_codon:yes gene_type:complete
MGDGTLGETLLTLRRRRRMNQHELAEALGVSIRTVARYETGLVWFMSLGTFIRAIDVLCETDEERDALVAIVRRGPRS